MGKKMAKYSLSGMLLLTLSSICGCFLSMENMDNRLKMINKSEDRIAIAINFDYPDTNYEHSIQIVYINPLDYNSIGLLNTKWERVLKKTEYVTIFIANEDSLRKYSSNWPKKVKPIKKILLGKTQLDSLDWKIYYP